MTLFRFSFIIIILACSASLHAQQRPARKPDSDKPATSQPGARAASSGAITGRVVAEGGQPVAGVLVTALPAGMSSSLPRTIASVLSPASTDDDGRFQLNSLPQGAYTVHVMMPGYVVSSDTYAGGYMRPGDTTVINLVKGGVITGKVTGLNGEPVVGARVRAIRVRDLENRPLGAGSLATFRLLSSFSLELDWMTDDRGIYRIYGLEPGVYHVSAGGMNRIPFGTSPYDSDAPTYYPSGTADTAADVVVGAGEEATNIDIRYRAMAGHSVSGTVSGPSNFVRSGVSVVLTQKASGALTGISFVLPSAASNGFMFEAVGDGEYYVTAYANSSSREEELALSQPHPITVKGGDVTGLNLTLEPLGRISGQVVIEPAQGADLKDKCKDSVAPRFDEVVVRALPADRNRPEKGYLQLLDMYLPGVPGDKGEIVIRHAGGGRHHLDIDLPASPWYVRSITLPGSTPAAKRLDAARDGLNLRSGGMLEGLVITLAEGAASIKGRVVPAKEGVAVPPRLRVHLVPAESEAADETLRYSETVTKADGSFEAHNLPPGRYWIVARAIPEEESPENPPLPLAWEASGRTGLRFEGEAINAAVELKPCQRVTDFVVKYTPPITGPTKKSGGR